MGHEEWGNAARRDAGAAPSAPDGTDGTAGSRPWPRPQIVNSSSPLVVAQVGPYPPQPNGIGDYMSDLCGALRAADPRVSALALAPRFPGTAEREPHVWRCWDPRSDWTAELLHEVDAAQPHVVHIQHGLYMGHGRRVARFLEGLRSRRIPGVITLHGVWPTAFFRRWPRRFHRALAGSADRLVIHQRAGSRGILLGHGVPPNRIEIIPHGTREASAVDPALARDKLDLARRPTVLFAGFIFRRKGLHTAVRAFESVSREVPEACLLAVGRVRTDHLIDRLYRLYLHWLTHRGREAGWLDYRPGYVSEEDLTLYYASADMIVFPYLRSYGSASGTLHRALAAGRPAVCSNVPTFAEAVEAWGKNLPDLIVPPGDVDSWSRALTQVLSRDDLRGRAAEASAELGRKSRWPSVADKHIRMYRALIAAGAR
jgi:polysaccharide biosynthesis protein PslF